MSLLMTRFVPPAVAKASPKSLAVVVAVLLPPSDAMVSEAAPTAIAVLIQQEGVTQSHSLRRVGHAVPVKITLFEHTESTRSRYGCPCLLYTSDAADE